MKRFGMLLCVALVLSLCFSGCQPTDLSESGLSENQTSALEERGASESQGASFHEGETMPDLELEFKLEVDSVAITAIDVVACDDLEGEGYFTGATVKASYEEGEEEMPLTQGLSYRVTLGGKSIQARDADPIYLKFSYTTEDGETFSAGNAAVSKEECWSGKTKQFVVCDAVTITPAS